MIKGRKIVLFQDGRMLEGNMRRALVSESDLQASLRKVTQQSNFANVEFAYMESNGQISFVLKNP